MHNLLVHLFSLRSSKIKVSETYFFDIVATHNEQPSYVKHIFKILFMCFVPHLGVHCRRNILCEGDLPSVIEF